MRWTLALALCGAAACSFDTPKPEALSKPAAPTWEQHTATAATAFKAGRYDEAENELVAAERLAERTEGGDAARATALYNLAILRRAQGQDAAAEDLYKEALAIRERVLGPQHPEVAVTLNNLAALYAAQDRYTDAEPLLQRALAIRERHTGADQRLYAQSLNNLALLYAAEAKYADAEPLYRRALAAQEKQLGPSHIDLAQTLENYAALLRETNRIGEAEALELRAAAIRAGAKPQAPAPARQ